MQTQIRLLLEEQSDQDLHCLLYHLHSFSFASFRDITPFSLNFRVFTVKLLGVRKFRMFTVASTRPDERVFCSN